MIQKYYAFELNRINLVTKIFKRRFKGRTKSQTTKLVDGDSVCTWRTVNDFTTEFSVVKIKKRRSKQVVDTADTVKFKQVTREVEKPHFSSLSFAWETTGIRNR